MLFQFNANQQVQLPPLFRAPTWHFRGVASSLLGPHQTGARVTTLNLTPPHPPMTDPMNPPDPPRDDCASWRFQSGVASSIQGPHPRQLAFPPHPCLAADHEFTWSQAVWADPQSGGSSRGSSLRQPGNVGGTSAWQFEPRTRRRQWWWRRKRRRR